MNILTKYENNNGGTDNCLEVSGETLEARQVPKIIAYIGEISLCSIDNIPARSTLWT